MHDIKLFIEKNAPALRAILMAMWIRQYEAKRIAHYSRSRDTLDATGHCHWASIHPVLLHQTPWSPIFVYIIKLFWRCETNF